MLVSTILEVMGHREEILPVLLDASTDMGLLAKVMEERNVTMEVRAKVFVWCALNKPSDLPEMLKHGNLRKILNTIGWSIPAAILERFSILEQLKAARGIDALSLPQDTLFVGEDSAICELVNPKWYFGEPWYFISSQWPIGEDDTKGDIGEEVAAITLKKLTASGKKDTVFDCIVLKAPLKSKRAFAPIVGEPKGYTPIADIHFSNYESGRIYACDTDKTKYCIVHYTSDRQGTTWIETKKHAYYISSQKVIRATTLPAFVSAVQKMFPVQAAPVTPEKEGGVEDVK